jgi:hypothetical protein
VPIKPKIVLAGKARRNYLGFYQFFDFTPFLAMAQFGALINCPKIALRSRALLIHFNT